MPDSAARAGRVIRVVKSVLRLYPLLVVLLFWQGLAHSGLVPPRLFPDLGLIGAAIVDFVASGDFLYHSLFTLQRAFIAFAIAVPSGILLGTLLARSRIFEMLVEPIFAFGYPIPKIALFPIFVFIFGLGSPSKVALAALEALYPITLSTYYGVRSAEKTLIWAAESMGGNQRRIFWRVLLPSAAPYIFSSLRIGMHVALIVIILLEIIGDTTGLGFYVTYASASYKYPSFFAGIAAIMLWGFLLDQITIHLRDRVVFWQSDKSRV